jgi:hypothetical protein
MPDIKHPFCDHPKCGAKNAASIQTHWFSFRTMWLVMHCLWTVQKRLMATSELAMAMKYETKTQTK